MSLGNFGVYSDLFEGIGRYKGFYVELDDGSLWQAGDVRVEQARVILSLGNIEVIEEEDYDGK